MAHPIHPSRLRPRRHWYAVAAATAALSLFCAFGGFIAAGLTTDQTVPDFDNVLFGNGKQLDVPFSADRGYAIYVLEGTPTRCTFGPGVTASLPAETYTFLREDETWKETFELSVASDGLYQVTCDAASFAIGETPPASSWHGPLAGLFLVVATLPCLGIPAAIVIVAVVASRRSSHRTQLLRRSY
ncbi:hypothetical protein [Cryptosporangium aurantiacum]|uniref:Uncharacterized protein n=1 Tax=Cryptosporangium aurantiacum TaxID=134849 RepID=A0A1M7RD35_9ACTN|nr:hypothetical protein [Cryptosporangium aurantiacum]SHN44124.1 hypothetical protein SAMN05443668_11071 [Cryptosporangium aurantiacum]